MSASQRYLQQRALASAPTLLSATDTQKQAAAAADLTYDLDCMSPDTLVELGRALNELSGRISDQLRRRL